MKYIKYFEGIMRSEDDPEYHMKKDEFKFKLGDIVKIVVNERTEDVYTEEDKKYIFKISGVASKEATETCDKYFLDYYIPKHEFGYGWVTENDLELVPDFELAANKYNL